MKITRDVIIDLLPLYFSGAASEDSKQLVEIYFEQNPQFAAEAKKSLEKNNFYLKQSWLVIYFINL